MVSGSRILHTASRLQRAALIPALALCVLAACEAPPPEEEDVVRPVRYARVAAQGASETRTYSGTARAEVETDLSFRVGGTVTGRPVNVGEEVSRGTLIATLDSTDFQVRLDEAQAGLARAEAERRNATANYQRTRDLYENQNASRTQLDSARSLAESAEAQHRAATQQVEAARLQLSYARLTAPQQCTVAQTFVEPNQNVSPGQPVVQLNCGECAELIVSVPDTDIAKIATGAEVTARVSALPGEALVGVVREVGVETGGGGTTYPVTIGLQDRCTEVRSGMAVDVTFDFRTSGSAGNLVVPYVAVGEDRTGRYVFVLEPGDDGNFIARRRQVTVGAATADGIVISEGLRAGELIATAGVRRLTDEQEVTLLGGPGNGPF